MAIEDLHWVDSASEDLLNQMATISERLPLMIMHTRRPEYHPPWVGRAEVSYLPLQPLSKAETAHIIEARFAANALPEELRQLVSAKAEGNPLFAEELVSFLLERGIVRRSAASLTFDAAAVASTLPASLQSLLVARVDRLSPAHRSVLQAAAVIGRRFDPDLLAVVAESGDIDASLAAMQALDLVRRDDEAGAYDFKHALVRDAVYGSLLKSACAALHLKIAEEVERRGANRLPEVAELLAYHYGCSSRADKAFQYLAAAGRKSLAVYSLDEAEEYCRKALRLVEAEPGCSTEQAVAEVIALLLEVLYLNGNNPAVAHEAERYMPRLEAMPDSPHLVVALGFYALTLGNKCDFRAGEAAANRALGIAERIGDARAEGYALVGLLFCGTALAKYSPAAAEFLGARLLANSEKTGDNYLQNWAYWCIAWDYLLRGLMNKSRDWAAKLISSGHQRGDPRALGMAYWTLGLIDLVGLSFDSAIANANTSVREAVTPYDRNLGLIVKATAEILQGRAAEGLVQVRKLRHWTSNAGFSYADRMLDLAEAVGLVLVGKRCGKGFEC
jgi:hypothetical protein